MDMDNDVLKFHREAVDWLSAKDSYTSAEILAILLGLLKYRIIKEKTMGNDVLKFYREALDRLGAKDSYTSAEISAILLGLYEESVGLGKQELLTEES